MGEEQVLKSRMQPIWKAKKKMMSLHIFSLLPFLFFIFLSNLGGITVGEEASSRGRGFNDQTSSYAFVFRESKSMIGRSTRLEKK